ARVLRDGRPDLVLLSRRQEPSVAVMQSHEDEWVLLYQDELAQLWGRATKYDDPASVYYLPPKKREVGDVVQRGWVHWPALPDYQPKPTPDTQSVPPDTQHLSQAHVHGHR
ncbi:MAG TPA: hypothetical protein VFV87_17620, partial [Pirellulaceae bacterium]|nr:hypothetical protein [Pirellulaceae bacterium]